MPQIEDVRIDDVLTGYAVAYSNEMDDYVADLVLPESPVENRSDRYKKYNKSTFLTGSGVNADGQAKSIRRVRTESQELDYTISTDLFYCEQYDRKAPLPDQEQNNAGNWINPRKDKTRQVTETLKIDCEAMAAWIVGRTTNYPVTNKVTLTTGTTSWAANASATSKPFNDLVNGRLAVRKGVIRMPNKLLLGGDTAEILSLHPAYIDRYKYVATDAISRAGVVANINGLMVIPAIAQSNNAVEGAAYGGGYIWQDESLRDIALVFRCDPSKGDESIHLGRRFTCKHPSKGQKGIGIWEYYDPAKQTTFIEGGFAEDRKLTATDDTGKILSGYLISGTTL
jgi:hypothetical protein